MHDDLLVARRVYTPQDILILDQLKVTGSHWEASEQLAMHTSGVRSYRVLVAYGGMDTKAYLESVSAQIFSVDARQHLQIKDVCWYADNKVIT